MQYLKIPTRSLKFASTYDINDAAVVETPTDHRTRGATKHQHRTNLPPLIPISLSLSATTLSGETITTPPHATVDRTSSPHHRMEWTLCIKEKSLHAQNVKYAILQSMYDYWKEKANNDSTPSAVDFSTNCQKPVRVLQFLDLANWRRLKLIQS
ncbi:hypothetical protein QL285_027188 [Trifolium repens]|nr:hypothetical protein QL285_027188 [Trifolium repens]